MKVNKRIIAWLSVFVLIMVNAVNVMAAETANPFLLTGTDTAKDAEEFTVLLQLTEPMAISAFNLSVEYDSAVLEVEDEEGAGYGYTDEFKESYQNGMLSCNDKNNSAVVFAGAKTSAASYSGTIARIKFRVKEGQSATKIVLKVGTVGVESDQGVEKVTISNPNIDYTIVLKELPSIPGDVNQDTKVDLTDAQLVLKAALKIISLNEEQRLLADVTMDGKVDLADAQIVLKKALKIIP